MLKKRERGDKYGRGLIKRQIFIKILDNPDGIKEADIRDFLLDRYGIREKKGIILHLSDLEKRGCIQKIAQIPGKINIWKPVQMDHRIFAKFWFQLSKEEVITVFQTKYVQDSIISMVIPYYLKYHALKGDGKQIEERVAAILEKEDFMHFIRDGLKVSPSILSFIYDMDSISGRSVGFSYATLWTYLTLFHEHGSSGAQQIYDSPSREETQKSSPIIPSDKGIRKIPRAVFSIELSAVIMILGGLLLDKMIYPELKEKIKDILDRGQSKGDTGVHLVYPGVLYDYIDNIEAIMDVI
jgi:hypothetical protein